MVLNTSDDLPDPETPVNTVSRRLGISTLMSFRLFSRAPGTRIWSWLSAGWRPEGGMFAMSSSVGRVVKVLQDPAVEPPACRLEARPRIAASTHEPRHVEHGDRRRIEL